MTIFFSEIQSILLFLSFESILFVIQLILAQFSNPLSTNSLYWVFWAYVHPSIGLGIQNLTLQYVYLSKIYF